MRRIAVALSVFALPLLLPPSSHGQSRVPSQPVGGEVEPSGGTWKTWLLASGSEMRLPPPQRAAVEAETRELKALAARRDAQTLEQIRFWDAGAPAYRWNEIALDHMIAKHKLNAVRVTRGIALMSVAVYDASVAAWDSKYAHRRARPAQADPSPSTAVATPRSPSYPSEHAVTAGAAAAVLAYLMPADAQLFADKAEQAARSRVLAGVNYPSDVAAGLELGRAVAARVIERAKADGSDAKWAGTVPAGPGHWNGTNPIEPAAGTWKTWVLSSGNQLRPGPPPAVDSEQMARELAEVKNFPRTFASNYAAFFWQSAPSIKLWNEIANRKIFEYRLDTNPLRVARIYALMHVATADSWIACMDAKYAYWQIRPFQLDPTVTTLFPTPNHPSYPAAHACNSGAMAAVLGYLFPQDSTWLTERAEEAAASRIWGGIHYRSDNDAGLALGRGVARLVIGRARKDGADVASRP